MQKYSRKRLIAAYVALCSIVASLLLQLVYGIVDIKQSKAKNMILSQYEELMK